MNGGTILVLHSYLTPLHFITNFHSLLKFPTWPLPSLSYNPTSDGREKIKGSFYFLPFIATCSLTLVFPICVKDEWMLFLPKASQHPYRALSCRTLPWPYTSPAGFHWFLLRLHIWLSVLLTPLFDTHPGGSQPPLQCYSHLKHPFSGLIAKCHQRGRHSWPPALSVT